MALSLVGASYIHKKVKNSLQDLECNKYKELKKKSEKKKKCGEINPLPSS